MATDADEYPALAAARGPLVDRHRLRRHVVVIAHASERALGRWPSSTVSRRWPGLRVITGRDLNTARRMVPVEGVVVVGSHASRSSMISSSRG
ncbi:MAG: hypothetical protein U0837_08640 [Dehalococcoidia bacterium]